MRWSQNDSAWSGVVISPLKKKKKFKTQHSAGKMMCTAFWDTKGAILWISWNLDKPLALMATLRH